MAMCASLHRWFSTARAQGLLLGQVIALLVALTGVFSTLLARGGAAFPCFQALCHYSLLSLYLAFRAARGGCASVLPDGSRDLRYHAHVAVLAFVDVEATFLVVTAYSYTSVLAVMLLDCATIPGVMFLSWMFLNAKYSLKHGIGVALCVSGLVVLAVTDALAASESGPSHALTGDLLCLSAAALYAVSNVMQEALVKRYESTDVLGKMGVVGACVSLVQSLLLERDVITSAFTDTQSRGATTGYLLGFALALFAMYSLTARFLRSSDATLFNLSLLSSDLWAILASALLFKDAIPPTYALALVLIVVGLILYNTAANPTAEAVTSGAKHELQTESETAVLSDTVLELDDAPALPSGMLSQPGAIGTFQAAAAAADARDRSR